MAWVPGWLPQSAGAVLAWAGWPGSNGSTMETNAGAVVASLIVGRADGLLAAEPADDEELLQPAARPIRAANPTARTRERLIIGSS